MTRRSSTFLVLLAMGVTYGAVAESARAEGAACCSKPASRSTMLTSAAPGEAAVSPSSAEMAEVLVPERKRNLWLLTGLLAGSVALGVVSIAHWRR